MKHNKVLAAVAAAGGLFAMSSAHAVAPLVAAAIAGAAGAAIGNAVTQPVQPPAVAVVPSTPAVVMGGPPAPVEEVIPAPQNGYHWERGHYELRNGVSAWVAGHWVADEVVIDTQ